MTPAEIVDALAALCRKEAHYFRLVRDVVAQERFDHVAAELGAAAAQMRAQRGSSGDAALRAALNDCLDWMESLRGSGDAGFWEWGASDAYTKGRAALATRKETP